MNATELNDALNLAAAPWPNKRKEWMEKALQMSKHCIGSENCDQAAMRVLAAEVMRLKAEKQSLTKMRQALNAALSWCKGDASAGLSLSLDKDCINARIKRLTDALK